MLDVIFPIVAAVSQAFTVYWGWRLISQPIIPTDSNRKLRFEIGFIICLLIGVGAVGAAAWQGKISSDRLVGNITGGDSYAWIVANIGPQFQSPFQLSVEVKGQYGVHNLAANIQSIPNSGQLPSNLPLNSGEFLPGVTPITAYLPAGRYAITIISRNQSSTEQLDIARCADGQWSEAIKMNGPGEKENDVQKGMPGCHQPF